MRKILRPAIVLVLFTGVLISCGTQQVVTVAAPEVAEPALARAATSDVNVYWSWSIPTIPAGTPERLGAGGRQSSSGNMASDAMTALLAGPNAAETAIGMGTNIPPGTTLLDLDISGAVATVDLSSEFEVSGGTLGETMRIAQVVFTLTQFDTVNLVKFRIDGVDRTEIASHGFDVSSGVDRGDFTDVRALITVERPYPGAEVADGFHIQGESNTFEATVEYAVTNADGLIVDEGFTTATAGTGEWGRFDITVDLPDDLRGSGAVIVFESSAKDGSQTNVVEYPVTFGSAQPSFTG